MLGEDLSPTSTVSVISVFIELRKSTVPRLLHHPVHEWLAVKNSFSTYVWSKVDSCFCEFLYIIKKIFCPLPLHGRKCLHLLSLLKGCDIFKLIWSSMFKVYSMTSLKNPYVYHRDRSTTESFERALYPLSSCSYFTQNKEKGEFFCNKLCALKTWAMEF